MGCCSGSVSFAKLVGPSRRGPLLSVLVAGLLLATQAPAQPNFRIGAIFLPAEAAVGDTFRPNVEVRNTGNANTTLYWSTGLLLLDPGATALPASPQFPGSADTGNNGSVPAGETRTWVGFVPTRGMALGSYKLGARADNANGIVELDETDNDAVSAGTIRLVTPTADLIVDRFQSPSRASRGDAIPMTATLKNIGTGPARFPSDCGFYISTDTTITREDRGLSGGGTYPGLPPGQTARLESCCVVIPADLAPGQYYVGAVADLYDAVGETNKANNGSPQPVALTVTSPGADLIVTTVQASAAAARIGDPIEVTATIKNQGAVSTPRGFSAIVALAQGRQATTTDPVVKYELVSALESGATSQVVFAGGSIPRNLAPGPYKLTVVADASFSIGESDETNNAFSVDFTVQPASADLRVDSVNAGPAAFRSTLFSAGAVVSNRGTGPAGAFLVTGYLSSDVTVTTQDQAMGESYEGGLAASTTAAITLSAIVPASLAPGSYTYGVIVDSRDDVVETNESNNVRAASGTVLLSQATADLTIESVQMPASVSAGDLFVATATVRNRGTGDVTTPFRVELLVSADVTLTVADTGIGRFDVASLAAGAAVTETFYAKVPRSIAPGTYTAGALADFDATVGETDETNNARAASGRFAISAPAADLVIDQFVFPASASVSSAFPATAVVRNRGSGNVVPDFNVGFVLSTDTTFTGADLILRGTTVRGLAAGQTFRAQESLTVPGAVAPGNYFAFAVADLYDDAGEIDETNNVSSRPFVVTPPPNVDLSVTAVRHDAARVSVGDSFPVTLTVHNAGPGATAAPFDLSVVLALRRQNGSPDPVVRSEVGRAPVALLAAGENRTLSFFVASNGALAPATYVMLGVADPENQIAETDETNNVFASAAPLTLDAARADLTIAGLTAPAGLSAGESAQASLTVRNAGSASVVSPFDVTVVLLPASGPIDSNALATLGRARVEGLAAGASTDVKVELAAPRELPAGRFRLAANADSEGQIGESSETNNRVVRTQPFDLGAAGADLTVTRLFAPRVVSVGQAMAIIVEVENRGTATAAGFGLELGLAASQSSTASAAGLGVHDVDAGLRPGERRLVGPFTGVVSADLTPAAYFALARADFYDQIAESNETNNVLVSIVPTTVIGIDQDDHPNTTAEARLPQDLLDTSGEPSVGLLAPPGDVDVFRFTAAAGSLLTIESSLPDPGGAADTLLILNGPNGSVLASNDDFGGGKASRIGPMALSAGGEFRLTVRSPNPRDRGLYAVRALVEPGRPDLRIVSISRGAPSAVGQGTTLRTTVVVENAGTATAVAGAVLEVYLSAAAVLSTSSVLVARLDVGEVEPGGQRPFPVEAIVDPARVGLGTWFPIASVDPAHALPDGVPGNNTAAADVAVTVVRAPDDHPDIPGGTASPRDDVTVGGAAAAGTLERGGDADCFRIPVELNREYVVETGAGTLDDTVLTLFGADGATVLAENDDAPGTRLSSVRFRPSFSGIAFARVRAFDPIATGTYAVSAHLAPPVSPRDHGAAADDASPVPIDRVVPGEIAPPGDADWFRIAVRGGTQYRFDVTPYSLRSLNVALFGPDGSTELQTATAPQGGEKASLVFTATLDRALFVRVRAADGTSTGQYIVSYSPTVRPSLAVELHRSGDAIVAGVAARGLQSFLARATLLVRLDAREVEYEGRFSAGPAVAGLDTRVQDTGGGVLVLRAFSASVRAASGTTPSGTLFSLTLRALHPGNVAPPGAATVVFAELVTDRDEAFQFNGFLADAGLDRRIPVALAGQQLLPTIPDPLLAPPDNRRAYVRLDGRLSTDPNLVPEPLSYRWSLLDGPGPVTLSDPASAVPTFAPSVSGSYAFALQVSNGSLQSAPSRVTVRIERPDVAPTAAPRAIEVASGRSTGPATPTLVVQAAVPEIELDGTRSFDPNAGDRNRLTYAWRQIAGPSAALTPTATAPAPHFAAAVPGRYDFELVVSDPGGNVSAAEPVSVLAVPPGDRLPALALLATASTTFAIGGAEPEPGEPPVAAPLRVAIPAQVSLLATLEDADLAANAGQQFRVRWSQLAGPPVDLEPPLDGPGPLRRSRARFTPTTAFLHEFECRATELDSVGHPTGIEVARRISVLVDSPSNACPSAVAGISTVAQKSRAPAAAPVTQLQAQMGATIRLSGAGSSDPGPARGALRYTWVQVSGPTVTLSNPYAAVTTFVAPDPGAVDRRIAFRLFVDDGSARGAPAPVELELLAVGSQVVPVTAFPGINLVAVAVAPSQPGFGARELLDLLRARFLARLDTTGGRSRFVPYSPSLAAIGFGVTGSEGYLAVLDTASPPASVGGTPWTTAELQRTLGPGLCLIALPRGVPAGYTLADLATLTTSRFVVYGETAGGRSRLRVYLPGVTPAAPFAESGKGYLLSVPQSVAVSLPGR